MTDCLNKDVKVSSAVYCQDEETGEIDPTTAMYSWMHVRAVGPNVLKDTTLCGQTTILGELDNRAQSQPAFEVYLGTADPTAVMVTTPPALQQWVPFGFPNYYNVAPYNYTLRYKGTQSNQEQGIFGYGIEPIKPAGAIGIYNSSGRNIVAHVTLTCTFQGTGVANGPFSQIALWRSGDFATPLPTDDSVQTFKPPFDFSYSSSVTCDILTLLKPDEVIQPIIRLFSGDTTSWSITGANLLAEYVEDYQSTGGPDELPNGADTPP